VKYSWKYVYDIVLSDVANISASIFIFDAFAQLQKGTISFAMSVRLGHGTILLTLDRFSWNLVFENFSKFCCGNL